MRRDTFYVAPLAGRLARLHGGFPPLQQTSFTAVRGKDRVWHHIQGATILSARSKLNEARKRFHSSAIKKTGKNTFAKYDYFELADFLIPALEIFYELKLSGIVSFDAEIASMTIVDLEDESSQVVITSPMSTAALKACHEVQNLGAVETYLRRYLWVAALEIVEHDAVDSGEGPERKEQPAKGKVAPKNGKKADPAQEIIDGVKAGDASGAATYLSGLSEGALKLIWEKLPDDIQDQLTAVWPA